MKKMSILLFALSIIFSSCVPEQRLLEKKSKIVDITYVSVPIYNKERGNYYLQTYAYFVLADGKEVPMPVNFNPSSPEQYIGKTITYSYWSKEQLREKTIPEENLGEGYKYICYKKYITSDNKCMIRYYTKTNKTIKTVQVSTEVYEHAREGFYIETEDIEPFIQIKE